MRPSCILAFAAAAVTGVVRPVTARAQQTEYIYVTQHYPKVGPLLAVDRWRSGPAGNDLGTNIGPGFRYETELPFEHVRSYMDCSVFVGRKLYTDATVNVVYSVDRLRASVAPYFGAGGTLVVGGDAAGASIDLVAGTQLRRAAKNIPFVEIRYLTSGGRLVGMLGLLF